MPTNTEYLKTLITTAGGDASSLPDNLESTHYKALIEAMANGTGGGGTSGGEYTVLVDEAITSDEGIAKIQYTDIDFHKYEDIVIYFDKPVNVSANTSGDRRINVYMLGYPIVRNYSVAGPDGYRSVLLRILNMKNDNVVCFSSVANHHHNNPNPLQCCGIYPLNQNYIAGYDIGFNLEFNIAYVGTCNLKIFAK